MSADFDAPGDETVEAARNRGGRPVSTNRGRYRKLACDSCGFIAQATAAAIDRLGAGAGPWPCPCGAGDLHLANFRDRAELDFTAARDEYATATTEMRAAMRAELKRAGIPSTWMEETGADFHGPETHLDRPRCQWHEGYCHKYAARGPYCLEHSPAAQAEARRAWDGRI